jgi:hypothetical protein
MNQGDSRDGAAFMTRYYQSNTGTNPWRHGGTYGGTPITFRKWGPSAAHSGVVQHCFGDGHAKAIPQDMRPEIYMSLVTKGGREVYDTGLEN